MEFEVFVVRLKCTVRSHQFNTDSLLVADREVGIGGDGGVRGLGAHAGGARPGRDGRGPWNMKRGPWNLKRGPWNLRRGPWSLKCLLVADGEVGVGGDGGIR